MAEAADKYAELRSKLLTESLETSNEPRWGYFGIPGSLAIGDNSYAPRLIKRKDEGAEPLRNIQAAPLKKGSSTDVYFEFAPPLCIGDPFQDPGAAMRKGKVTMLDPEAAFKPPGKVRESVNKLGYEYVPHMDSAKDPKAVKEKYKDYMPPRQIYTNPSKKGGGGTLTTGVLFGFGEDRKFVEYMPDDFDAARKQRRKELEEHRAHLQDMPFKGCDYGNQPFQTNNEAFGYDVPTHIPRDPKPDNIKPYPHESAFRPSNPSKKGVLDGLLGGLPEWVADPAPATATRRAKPDSEAPPAFKIGCPRQPCNPTPSVTTMTRNMRSERPSSFMRPSL